MATNQDSAYGELLRLDLRHSYFLSGQLPALALAPTQATAERLRRAGLLLRQLPSGFVLLLPGNLPLPAAAQQILAKRVFPLVFALQPRTTAFHLYTDLPPQAADSPATYAFGLAAGYAGEAATGPSSHYVAGPQSLALRPLMFDYRLPRQLSSGEETVVTQAELWASGEQLAVWPPVPPLAPPTVRALTLSPHAATVNVRQWGSGRYQLRLGGTTLDFYADDDAYAARSWGLLELDAAALAQAEALRYVLQLRARRAYWQYHFQLKVRGEELPSLPRMEVREARGKLQNPVEFELVSTNPSQAKVIFCSKESILLNERYEGRQYELFAIHSAMHGTEPKWRKLLSPLPHADIQQLRPGKDELIAEIFVSVRT